MKKLCLITLCLALLILTGLSACQAAPPAKLSFKFASYRPEIHFAGKVIQKYCNEVATATNGQVEFKLYPAESLVKRTEQWIACTQGTVDAIGSGSVEFGIILPWANALTIPGWASDNNDANTKFKQLSSTFEADFAAKGLKMLWAIPAISDSDAYSRKGFIKTIDDFKGLKLRSGGGYYALVMNEWGASGVTIETSDQYDALQRGTVDATMTGSASGLSLKLYEPAPYVTLFSFPNYCQVQLMNMDAWNKIPAAAQKQMLEIGLKIQDESAQAFEDDRQQNLKKMAAIGAKTFEAPASLKQEMLKRTKPVWEKFIQEGGAVGKKMYEAWYR